MPDYIFQKWSRQYISQPLCPSESVVSSERWGFDSHSLNLGGSVVCGEIGDE